MNINVPLDYFGVASAVAVKHLTNSALSRRERLTSFRTLEKLAKLSKTISKDAKVTFIGITTDFAGGICLSFTVESPAIDLTAENLLTMSTREIMAIQEHQHD